MANSRSEAMKAIMRRKENVKLMKEAMASPIGSTSRLKAQKIFSIMGKLNNSYDGAGGPGLLMNRQIQEFPQDFSQPEQNSDYSAQDRLRPMVVFQKIPKPKITYGKRKPVVQPTKMDGGGGPGVYDGRGGFFDQFSGGRVDNAFSTALTNFPNAPVMNNGRVAMPSSQNYNFTNSSVNPLGNYNASSTPNTQLYGSLTPGGNLTASPQNSLITVRGGFTAPVTSPWLQQPTPWQAPGGQTGTFGGQPNWRLPEPLSKGLPSVPLSSTPIRASDIVRAKALNQQNIPPQGETTEGSVASTSAMTRDGQIDYASMFGSPITQQPEGGQDVATGEKFTFDREIITPGIAVPSAPNIAAANIGKALNIPVTTDPDNIPTPVFMKAIADNEGYTSGQSKIAISHNNPGNLKFNNQPFATQGDRAPDGGYYAKFETINDGWSALARDIDAKKASSDSRFSTLDGFMSVYSPNEGGGAAPSLMTKYSGLSSTFEDDIKNFGPDYAAYRQMMAKNDPITGGKTLEQSLIDEKNALYKEFDIVEKKKKAELLQQEVADLPEDMAEYIRARDQYIRQTDEAINTYVNVTMKSMDMSNPSNVNTANKYLDYLYTLRGRQAKSYVGYINDAVDQHQKRLDSAIKDYNDTVGIVNERLTSASAIKKSEYEGYYKAIFGMASTIQDAPIRALQIQQLQENVLKTHAQTIADLTDDKFGYFKQREDLKGLIIDNNGNVLPAIDLMEKLGTYAEIQSSAQAQNTIQTYIDGVAKYMNSPEDPKPEDSTGTGITVNTKIDTAEWAIKQFAQLAMVGASLNDSNIVDLGTKHANSVKDMLEKQIAAKVLPRIEQLNNAILGLAPTGIFGGAKPIPSMDEFVAKATEDSSTPLDISIAQAIYAVFEFYVMGDKNKPMSSQDAITALLDMTSSTEDRSNLQPVAKTNLAMRIGKIYAEDVWRSEFNELLNPNAK